MKEVRYRRRRRRSFRSPSLSRFVVGLTDKNKVKGSLFSLKVLRRRFQLDPNAFRYLNV